MDPIARCMLCKCLYLKRLLVVLLAVALQSAWAANEPSLTFYVPFPEADALTAFDTINTAAVLPITTYVSIAAIADGTIIYYDHWEDGYEKTHHLRTPVQTTTQIWGDGNPANGYPPGLTNDIINAGTVILLYNTVNPTNTSSVVYDARDKIVANRAIAVTRTYWAAGSGTLMAGSVETYETSKWGTDYRVPVGENIPDGTVANEGDHQMFEYTALSIMASETGTVVMVDADNNGLYETTNTLNEGETLFVNGGVNVGGHVVSSKPVQVMLLAGDKGSNYETRDSTLLPVSLWSSSYYAPVATASGNGTRVWLYNPSTNSITVNYRYRVGSAASVTTNSVTVGTGTNAYVSVLLTDGSGTQFFTTGSTPPVFYAYSTTDSDTVSTSDNQAWDWSYTLVSKPLLTPQVLVGLGLGRDPLSTVNTNEDGNPIWVTTVGNGESNATVYVDYNGDNKGAYTDPNGNHYDASFVARELQPLKIYDPDGDQTAMLIYVLSTNVALAAAWGQDPTTATAGEPGLDAGTAVPPVDVFDVSKALAIVADLDGNGQLSPGERISYEIVFGNTSRAPVPADFIVQDVLPADTRYVTGSTAYRTSTNNSWIAIADDASGTAFPLDGTGYCIRAALPVKDFFSVRFQVDVNAVSNLTAGRVSIVNTGAVTSVVFNRTLPFKNDTYLHGSIGDRVWYDANGNGVQDDGESGIGGVVIYLDANTNGVRDANEFTATTDVSGYYLMTNALMEAGSWILKVDRSTLPAAYAIQTYDLDGIATPDTAAVTLVAGQNRRDVDFGYTIPARLGDFVWVDANGNGQQDSGEPGLPNVVVRLFDANDVVVATATTTVAGAYAFTNLAAGTYTVEFTPPAGYLFTTSNVGNDASDSDSLAGTNRTAAITLTGGGTNLTVDVGFYLSASLAGTVYIDANGNGVADVTDTNAIAGVTVLLFDAASKTVSAATTSATGSYLFTNLAPGSYTVVQVLPSGYTNTLDAVGANDLRVLRTLTSGQNSTGNDFYDTRSLSGTAQGKVLYLSDPSQALDRIDPVAANDTTATNTVTLAAQVAGVITHAATTSSSGTGSTLTFSHTPGTGTNRLLLVSVVTGSTSGTSANAPTVSGITFGGSAMTLVGSVPDPGNRVRVYIYQMVNPPSGAANVIVSAASSAPIYAGASTYTGVDQASPLGSFHSVAVGDASGAGGVTSVTLSGVASSTGELVYGAVGVDADGTAVAIAAGSGQTSQWEIESGTVASAGVSTAPGAASVSLSYSWSGAQQAGLGAVSIRPASGGEPTATFTQAPAFSLPFDMAAGAQILVTNYIQIVSGTMPANPAITARLSAGGSTFLTLSAPTYNSGSGTLVWSGALGSAVAISAGQAISLSVSNAQSGVEFRIRYDSATYPSKIILPTASIVAVPSLGIFDAPYSGGVPVSATQAGVTRYIRLTATDPFGSADVTRVGLLIDGPGAAGDISATLSNAAVVASNDWSKTYEYVWKTSSTTGRYSITATAYEGTEGVTATGTVAHMVYTAALGDRVFADYNNNGVWDAGEGLTGVVVTVVGDVNGDGVSETLTTTTGADGYYAFTNLYASAAGVSYAVTVNTGNLPAGLTVNTVDPDGGGNSSSTVVLTLADSVRMDQDFGYRSPAVYTISGQVRDDYDANGLFSDPDRPVGGVVVTLYTDPNGDGNPSDGVALQSQRTSQSGGYVFSNVIASAYVLVETDPAHATSTADKVAANDNRVPVVIVNSSSSGNDFLDAVDPTGYLYDVADGRIVPGGSVSASGPGVLPLMDGSTGQYSFVTTNGTAAVYTVTVTPPPGYILDPTRLPAGALFDATSSANPTVLGSYESSTNHGYLVSSSAASNTYYFAFELAPGDTPVINNNFPLVKTVTLGDRVWMDANGNGVQDAGETGMTNVTVRLLNASSNLVSATATDATGSYLFTNLPPATYQVEFVAPTQYVFTARDASTNDWGDSDADRATGRTAPVTLAAGVTNLTVDAGLYVPAVVYGYLFVDRNADLLRDTGDASLTNVLVRLTVNGSVVASTNTDIRGYYFFTNTPPGAITLLVSRTSATLIAVPSTGPAATSVTRNRALPDKTGADAYVPYSVVPGYGVLASLPGEPLNFGFSSYSLSTAIDLQVYASGNGDVTLSLWTVNESGFDDIVVYAWIGNAWVEVGRVPSDQVVGEGSNPYKIKANGLVAGGSYYFRIVDEAGHVHDTAAPISVGSITVKAVRLEMNTLLLTFNTELGRSYVVKVCEDLSAPDSEWTVEYVSPKKGKDWAEYSNQPFVADGDQTAVRVPVNRKKAFYKIVMVED